MPLLAGKCLQTPVQEPALVWPVKKSGRFLVVSGHPRRYGVALVAEKPDGATAAGNLAAVVRTWGDTLMFPAIWFDRESRTWWIPAGADVNQPRAYVRLVGGTAPEITLVECVPEPCVRMRLSTAGIFTKRRALDFVLPHQMTAPAREGLIDILPELERENRDDHAVAGGSTPEEGGMLPLYQRTARDKLGRRLKTLRKSLQNQERHKPLDSVVDEARAKALRLQSGGAGREIDEAFKEVKRLEKAANEAGGHLATLRKSVEAAEADLARLRDRAMPADEVAKVMRRHGIKSQPSGAAAKPVRPVASDWHEFKLKDGVTILVGKGAAESDRLVKAAASNDWWFHVVGSTGSHVIVPARQFRGQSELPAAVARCAGILAVHYSKLRDGCAGEVYAARKGNLRKRKGDPAGLWQVDRSGSMMIRYDASELASIFDQAQGQLPWRT